VEVRSKPLTKELFDLLKEEKYVDFIDMFYSDTSDEHKIYENPMDCTYVKYKDIEVKTSEFQTKNKYLITLTSHHVILFILKHSGYHYRGFIPLIDTCYYMHHFGLGKQYVKRNKRGYPDWGRIGWHGSVNPPRDMDGFPLVYYPKLAY